MNHFSRPLLYRNANAEDRRALDLGAPLPTVTVTGPPSKSLPRLHWHPSAVGSPALNPPFPGTLGGSHPSSLCPFAAPSRSSSPTGYFVPQVEHIRKQRHARRGRVCGSARRWARTKGCRPKSPLPLHVSALVRHWPICLLRAAGWPSSVVMVARRDPKTQAASGQPRRGRRSSETTATSAVSKPATGRKQSSAPSSSSPPSSSCDAKTRSLEPFHHPPASSFVMRRQSSH